MLQQAAWVRGPRTGRRRQDGGLGMFCCSANKRLQWRCDLAIMASVFGCSKEVIVHLSTNGGFSA